VEFSIATAVIIFFADFFYWFLTVFLIDKVVESKSIKSGFFAAALNFSSSIAVFYFVKNLEYLTPACLGSFVGAVLAVEYDKRRQKTAKTKLQKRKKPAKG
jgi:L-lactate permease